MQRKKIISKTVIILCCIILAAFFIFPILLLFINSFKSLKEIYISVLQLPKTLNLDNYISAFQNLDYHPTQSAVLWQRGYWYDIRQKQAN